MPTSFSFLGITFYFYGLIIGLAMVVVIKIAELVLQKNNKNADVIWNVSLWLIIPGIIGSRLWHVITDFDLYQDNVIEALYIWQGGGSILGGILGGVVGLFLIRKFVLPATIQIVLISDVLSIGLPFGQALGRLGNWVNQELYGAPTNVPWKLYIDKAYRIPGYENVEYFHPLFLYELLAMLVYGLVVWWLSSKPFWHIGRGLLTWMYVTYYCLVRFLLEFLRLDKPLLYGTQLSTNQVIVAIVGIVATIVFIQKYQTLYKNRL